MNYMNVLLLTKKNLLPFIETGEPPPFVRLNEEDNFKGDFMLEVSILDKYESNETHYIVKNFKRLTKILKLGRDFGITNLPIKIDFESCFDLCTRLEREDLDLCDFDITGWDVSKVTNMCRMFEKSHAFNQDISGWDVSKVTNMKAMFYDAYSFNQDISGWNVSKVEDMSYMFQNAHSFNSKFNPF